MSAVTDFGKSRLAGEVEITMEKTPESRKLCEKENEPLSEEEKTECRELSNIEKELDEEIEKMKADLEAGPSMKNTMDRLHEYNEIKDAAQIVLGAMASMHGVTIASLHQEYSLPMGEEWWKTEYHIVDYLLILSHV